MKGTQVSPELLGQVELATWAAGSLQTLHTVPKVNAATRAPVGTVKGGHSVLGLAGLP
jgi:hypothetical protein